MSTTLIAKNKHQLDLCLRLIFKEDVSYTVIVSETDDAKRKIFFQIKITGEETMVTNLVERYRIMIS